MLLTERVPLQTGNIMEMLWQHKNTCAPEDNDKNYEWSLDYLLELALQV